MSDNISIDNGSRPKLPRHLFWDWRYDAIDWQDLYSSIIARVIERGTAEEWDELLLFYGYDKVLSALKNEIKYLPDHAIDKVVDYFHIQKEELVCYIRKQSRQGHWP